MLKKVAPNCSKFVKSDSVILDVDTVIYYHNGYCITRNNNNHINSIPCTLNLENHSQFITFFDKYGVIFLNKNYIISCVKNSDPNNNYFIIYVSFINYDNKLTCSFDNEEECIKNFDKIYDHLN